VAGVGWWNNQQANIHQQELYTQLSQLNTILDVLDEFELAMEDLDNVDKLNSILGKLDAVQKLDIILMNLETLKEMNQQILMQLEDVVTFVQTQVEFNDEMRQMIEGLNATTVYEIHNETFTQVNQTVIDDAVFLTHIDDLALDVDIDVYVERRGLIPRWYVECETQEHDPPIPVDGE